MSIRNKLVLAFSVVVLLAAAVAGYGVNLISTTSSLVVQLYDGPLMGVSYARSAQINFSEARHAVEKAIARHDAANPDELASIETAVGQFDSDLSVVRERMGKADGLKENIDKIKPLLDDWYKAGMSYLKSQGSGVTQLPLAERVIEKGQTVQQAIDTVVEYASAYGFNFRSEAEATAAKSRTNLILAAAVVIVAGLVLATMMASSFSRPIRHAMAISEEIASGNFSVQIVTKRRDELGRLLVSLDKTRESLDGTVSGIISAANEVSTAAAEISSSTTDLSERTEEQAAGLAKTAASLDSISMMVRGNAENAQRANEVTSSMRKVADESTSVVGSAVSAMARIEESSHKIGEIIVVIDEIARQTNLLALNAAVEAARAGEAGRGFAVVASEVRSLAQRSAQAAKDITGLIGNSSGQVKDGVDLVNRTGEALNQIVESVRKVSTIVADIAETAGEQAHGIEEVKQALMQLDEMTQQNSALVEENAATAKALDLQSADMTERVAFFRREAADEEAAEVEAESADEEFNQAA
jgi:methyl-accepting chemotaxis protein